MHNGVQARPNFRSLSRCSHYESNSAAVMADASFELSEPENLYQDSQRDDSVGFSRSAADEPPANNELLSGADDDETVYSMDG